MNEDFLKIIEDSDVVNKIVEVIKEKQNYIAEDNTDTTLASKTTKQVVTDTLDAKNLDIMSVVLDFMNELQNAILQVKMKLAREQDTKTLQQAKVETNASQPWKTEQKEQPAESNKKSDELVEKIGELTNQLQEKTNDMVDSLQQMNQKSEKWLIENNKETSSLLKTFGVGG